MSFRRFTVSAQQPLKRHNTSYKHCTISSHMHWDAHCNCEVVFVRSTEQPVFCVVQQNYVWKLLYTLKSFHLRMSTNMILYYSLEYSQYISRCFIVHRWYVANSKLVKYEYRTILQLIIRLTYFRMCTCKYRIFNTLIWGKYKYRTILQLIIRLTYFRICRCKYRIFNTLIWENINIGQYYS